MIHSSFRQMQPRCLQCTSRLVLADAVITLALPFIRCMDAFEVGTHI